MTAQTPRCGPNSEARKRAAEGAVGSGRVKISDGSSWPLPVLESDAQSGVGWVLRYSEPTRADLLQAAAIIDAYGHLVAESTQAKRDLVCREVRAALISTPPEGQRGAR